MDLIQLVYMSTAKMAVTDTELLAILRQSRENNAQHDITGMLLYKDHNFLQLLEGPEAAVMALYDKISRDPRHDSVTLVLKHHVAARQFGAWSMGFANAEKHMAQGEAGLSDFLNQPMTVETILPASRAVELLLTFREMQDL